MTETRLRRVKDRAYGIEDPGEWSILGFYWDASTIQAWGYSDVGGYVGTVASATLPESTAGPALHMHRLIHAPIEGYTTGPAFVWAHATSLYLVVWDLLSNAITKIPVPLPSGATAMSLGAPFGPPTPDGWLYFFGREDIDPVGFRGDLWRVRPDGSTTPAIVTNGSFGIGTIGSPVNSSTCDDTYAYLFGGTGADVWRYPLAGGSATKVPNVSQSQRLSNYPTYYVGEDVDYDIFIVGPFGSAVDGNFTPSTMRLRHSKSTGRWFLGAFAIDDAQSGKNLAVDAGHSGTAHCTLNADRDTGGYYPWDATGGSVMKLTQPAGDATAEGNDADDPQITLEAVEGSVPIVAHLYTYSHPWTP